MATFGKKWNEPGPWSLDNPVHKIKGGNSKARRGKLQATVSQKNFLRDLGYSGPWDLTRSQASDAIDNLKRKRRT